MQTTAKSKKRLFIVASVVDLKSAEALIAEAERAYAVRDYEKVTSLGGALILSGLPAYRSIGDYFVGLGGFANGKGSADAALRRYGSALSHAPSHYRQRIFVSLSILLYHQREYERAVRSFEQLARLDDLHAVTEARRALAVFDSLEGNHRRAVERLEALYGMVRGKDSLLHLPADVANSLAVELNALGRHQEARTLSDEALASNYAASRPEWHQTRASIPGPRRLIPFPGRRDARAVGLAWVEFDDLIKKNRLRFSVENVKTLTETARGFLKRQVVSEYQP